MSHRLVISPEDYSGDAEPLSPVSYWCATVTVGQTPATSTCQRGLMSLGLTTPRLRCMLAAMSVSVQNVYIYMYIYIHILRTKSTSRRQQLAKALLLFNYKQIAWRLGCVSQAGKVCPRSCQRSRAGPAQMRLRKAPELFRISGM